MKTYIIIKADTNDADYISKKTEIKNKEDLEIVKKVCHVLSENRTTDWGKRDLKEKFNDPYRFEKTGELTVYDVDFFNNLVPSGEYGIHSKNLSKY